MSYKDNYDKRKYYGNDSERVLLDYCRDQKIRYANFGVEPYLDNNEFSYKHPNYRHMDNRLKKQPDYIINAKDDIVFVECKGSGVNENMEYVVRLKEKDINGYVYWQNFRPTYIFIAYNFNKSKILISLNKIIETMHLVEQEEYPDNGMKYRTIKINDIIDYDRITIL